jgi:hypothetical protein
VCPERKVRRCRRSCCDPCCASDGGRSSGFAVQAGSPNRRDVMPVKAGVGSDHGNGSLTAGQVCDEKTNMVEPLLTHRKIMTASQPGSVYISGRAPCLGHGVARGRPACRSGGARCQGGVSSSWALAWKRRTCVSIPSAGLDRVSLARWLREGGPWAAETVRGRVPRGAGADRLVVAMKVL